MRQKFICVLFFAALSAGPALAQDDLMERIMLLEQQIQELKTLKEQQSVSTIKTEQCMKAVAREKFCSCIGNNLPRDVNFEQYIHTLVSTKEALGYIAMTHEQQKQVDATIETREKCIEKGFFK